MSKTYQLETRLADIKPGEVFSDYIVLEHFPNETTAVLSKNIVKTMEFGSTNDWRTSDVRKYLNNEYVREVEDSFGVGNIFHHTVDGLNDYNTTTDKISLLTIDRYREYRSVIGPNLLSWWWLSTPDSTPSGDGSRCVRGVGSFGGVDCFGCGCAGVFARFLS